MNNTDPEISKEGVRQRYGAIATGQANFTGEAKQFSCCGGSESVANDCGCDCSADEQAHTLGYSAGDVGAVPQGANLGLGCGNPLAIASLKQGQTVLDLGSGAGFDAFLAARAVGSSGKVLGVDMTAEMVAKARANAKRGRLYPGGVSPRRNRGASRGRRKHRCYHLQLRQQPVP